ncbi:HutD/Ves family protein [Ancylobacter lacus]|uniref:HutD/Ves family protein n=1 Tax=Ancylobacter lacus TaxID=2579970 RepID=UPI001BCB8AF8|nr:HutD family protein [Ancylobacter lacus]MBS7538929.1 HutD family protein [Ancylobacter lacus]
MTETRPFRWRHIRPADHSVIPWKNGGGITRDIVLLPAGSGHDDFDIRVSLAPIVTDGPFSSFPGIERHITLLHGAGLELVFDGQARALERLRPLTFDSVLAPSSRLAGGAVEVLNVMTRRGRWQAQVLPLAGGSAPALAAPPGGHVVLHAVRGVWRFDDGSGAPRLEAGDTLMAEGPATLHPAAGAEGEAIAALLSPVGGAAALG